MAPRRSNPTLCYNDTTAKQQIVEGFYRTTVHSSVPFSSAHHSLLLRVWSEKLPTKDGCLSETITDISSKTRDGFLNYNCVLSYNQLRLPYYDRTQLVIHCENIKATGWATLFSLENAALFKNLNLH